MLIHFDSCLFLFNLCKKVKMADLIFSWILCEFSHMFMNIQDFIKFRKFHVSSISLERSTLTKIFQREKIWNFENTISAENFWNFGIFEIRIFMEPTDHRIKWLDWKKFEISHFGQKFQIFEIFMFHKLF